VVDRYIGKTSALERLRPWEDGGLWNTGPVTNSTWNEDAERMTERTSALSELERDISHAMQADRHRLRQQLRAIRQAEQAAQPLDRNLARFKEALEKSRAQLAARQRGLPQIRYSEDLPIAARRAEIADALRQRQVLIVCGETGSGKSTQLPKICLEQGRGIAGLIGHTQPRRIAARSIAARVAEELGVPLGREVGYKIRFADQTSQNTYVKVMTDGVLLAESQTDRFLDQYDTLIIDEAHERSLNIDFLLGYVKRLLPRRPDLKLIITSATIDAARFAEHFPSQYGPAPIILVEGRTYPVEVRYRPPTNLDQEEADPQEELLAAVEELARESPGDMLIFQPTERDIRETAKILRGRTLAGDLGRKTEILPLYGRLSTTEQSRIFQPTPHRRIVIATNVAESSITVPRIRYVIDPGTARISRYSARTQVQRLPIEPISQASADQRKGRCGRIGPGVCIRLYSEEDYRSREPFTPPEILRTNLASVILQTMALKLGPLEEFPFLEPPKPASIRDGYRTLFELGAIDEQQQLTDLGRKLAKIPTDPRIARMILAGHENNCLHEILIIASALEVQDPRDRPLEKQQAADEAHAQFAHEESDFLGLLKIWDFFQHLKETLSQSKLRRACVQNFLSFNRLKEWQDIHLQLLEIVEESGLKQHARKDEYAPIHKALLVGLLANVALKGDSHEYTGGLNNKFQLWPGSGIFAKKPKWIVAAELVETNRRYLRTVARIEPEWIEPLALHLVQRSYSDPAWNRKSSSVLAAEKVTLFGLPIVPRRSVRYGPIDPVRSRELFLQHALVEGEFDTRAAFFPHNRALAMELEQLQAKSRRYDLLLGEFAKYEFYDARIPADVYDGPSFEKWRREIERTQPQLLHMTRADLLQAEAEDVDPAAFPNVLPSPRLPLPLEYRFEPGAADDGLTVIVPEAGLGQLDSRQLGWLVPGLVEQKVLALIKSLPKRLRSNFVPAADVAKIVSRELRFGEGDLVISVAAALSKRAGESISPADFQDDKLPEHLRLNVRVVDAGGKARAQSRDLNALREELGVAATVQAAVIEDIRWQRDKLTTWDFGPLPEKLEIVRGGVKLPAFPALLDQGEFVSLRLLETPERAAAETRAGVRRLWTLAVKKELKQQVAWLPQSDRLRILAAGMPDSARIADQLGELLVERAFCADGTLPRDPATFERMAQTGRKRLPVAVQEISQVLPSLFEQYHQARLALERASNSQWTVVTQDLRDQLAKLTAAGFLVRTPWDWLKQFPRYFRGMQMRLQKLTSGGLPRDLAQMKIFGPLWKAVWDRSAAHAARNVIDPEWTQARWLLEELRVSFFAQELGTVQPVSPQRFEKQWAKVQP